MSRSSRSPSNLVPQMACAVLMYAGGAAGVYAAPSPSVVLPALTQPASGEHHIGKVIWADLVTPDIDAAKHFYGALFGWTFREVPGDPNYSLALLNGEAVAGLFQKALPAGQSQQPAWLTFLAVRDVNGAQQTAVRLGGTVLSKSHVYPQRGRQAVLADPDGAVFAVLAAQGGDPPDYLAEPGEWIWSSLLVKDLKAETAFYKSLFGYDVYDLASEGESDAQHYILSSDDYARAGLNVLPADSKRRHPHWLNFVRVTDAADTAAKAVGLGGRVLVEPRIDRHGGHLAILADPSGAPFGVMEWSDTDSKQEPQ
ncbi:MAG: VOC family protein [Steroidobacteraceae bacterium]|jgi:predicted enzyme related to lactoylglutathione lyase